MFKPFGNGMRACIGRPFAWQEALLTTATLLQTFRFTKANPSYTLQIKTSLTIKPYEFYMKAHLRDPDFLDHAGHLAGGEKAAKDSINKSSKNANVDASNLKPIQILFGSNTGTCEAVAQNLAGAAAGHGFKAEVQSMDAAVSTLKKDVPVVIVTASYEGQPPDNATHFVEWLESNPGDEVKDVQYAVFGLGNSKSSPTRSAYTHLPWLQRNGTLHTSEFLRLWTRLLRRTARSVLPTVSRWT